MTELNVDANLGLDKRKKYINKFKLYFGGDFEVDKNLIIHQPSIQEIIDVGEDNLFKILNVFIGNTTMYRLSLWKAGTDWNNISDFELFATLVTSIEDTDAKRLLFGEFDFSKLKYGIIRKSNVDDSEDIEEMVLYDLNQRIIIDEELYLYMREGLRYIFNIYPKTEFAKGKTTKEWIIQEEIEKTEQQKKAEPKQFFLPLISFCLNHPGFKYKSFELKEIRIVEFMDSVKQLQHNENVIALLHGVNSGFVDGSKIDPARFNFIRDNL